MKDVIKAPIVTEKTQSIQSNGKKIVLKVDKKANKVQIKQAVKEAFGVDAVSINTVNVRSKKKRVGRYTGATKAYKKAIVTLKEGSNLDLS